MATTAEAYACDPLQHHYQVQQHHQQGHNNGDPKEPNIFIPDIIEERKKVPEGYAVVHKFACGKLLGKGGFARCYVGTSTTTNGKYALKIVPKCNILKPRAKQKLQSEIKIHRALSHVNIVKFDRCFEDANNAYILLELCSNNSMSEMMKKRRKLIEPEVRYYAAHLINSLQYLHKNLVVHRDLKLGNLFIDCLMRLKVGDFGLAAKLNDPDEKRKTVCGTPNYIAPEILQGKDGHSFEVDIWSTGVVIYTLLVGKPPFETKDVKSTYKRITECAYSFPEGCNVSDNAKSLIRNMLQLRPERRPSLDEIMDHPFFSHPSSYLPSSLPESALREAPVFNTSNNSDIVRKSSALAAAIAVTKPNSLNRYSDENDPSAMNRISPSFGPSSSSSSNSNNNNNLVKLSNFAITELGSSLGSQGAPSKSFPSKQISADAKHTIQPLNNIVASGSGPNSNVRSASASAASRVSSKVETKAKSPNSSSSSSASTVSQSQQHNSYNLVESVGASIKSTAAASNFSNPSINRLSNSGGSGGGLTVQSKPTSASIAQFNNFTSVTSSASVKTAFDVYNDNNNNSNNVASSSSTAVSSISSSLTKAQSDSLSRQNYNSALSSNYNNPIGSSKSYNACDNFSSSSSVASTTSSVKSGVSVVSSSASIATTIEGSSKSSSVITKPLVQTATSTVANTFESASDGYLNRHINSKQSHTRQQQHISSAVDDIQQDIENIRVDENKPHSNLDSNTRGSTSSGGDAIDAFISNRFGGPAAKANRHIDLAKKPQAWAWDDDKTDNVDNTSNPSNNDKGTERYSHNNLNPAILQTPAANIIPANSGNEQINTLEAMHKMLDHSFINNNSPPGNKNYLANISSKVNGNKDISLNEDNLVSKVWVVRYVDYTSKYGLGFLLNTGSAGVYFNDSTKIILSPDGSVFQYIERRKKDLSAFSGEHVTQAHSMAAYPMELQKKVLLLRHFRNYLIEQQKIGQEKLSQDELDNYSEPIHSLPMLQDTGISGANSNIPFGTSSISLQKTFDLEANEMTYVKKWVRTRHAILFRLSNKTVQIVFFDRSEIILSSEARIVTYVNKQGLRQEFSLEEVMQDGRADIAKRLRYTKDIMYRLINSQQPR